MSVSSLDRDTRMHVRIGTPGFLRRGGLCALGLLAVCLLSACSAGPVILKYRDQTIIDRKYVEYPAGFELRKFITGLTAPTGISFDSDGTLYIAEIGPDGDEPHIFGVKPDLTTVNVYPTSSRIPFSPVQPGFQIYGPVGGILADHKKIYVSHRDSAGKGVITEFGLDGTHHTVVADLPAQGDYGVTDLVLYNGRIYFGMGSATNSGVVGQDNRWLKKTPDVCDQSYLDLELRGIRFSTPNPFGGLLSASADVAVTGPYQPFGVSTQARIPAARNGKPNSAIYSVNPDGGDLKVFAYGFRYPRGLGVSENGVLYATNNGMELRGSRPVKDDPCVLIRVDEGANGGFPDYTTNCLPVSNAEFQPPVQLVLKSGFAKVTSVVDQDATHDPSGNSLSPPRPNWVKAKFAPLSGAAKFEFFPASGPFGKMRGDAVVALHGDHAPYATSGVELLAPVGYKLVRVNMDTGKVDEFIHNTQFLPASRTNGVGIERPIDAKIGPDGALYVVDFGRLEVKPSGRERIGNRSGAIYRLVAAPEHPASK